MAANSREGSALAHLSLTRSDMNAIADAILDLNKLRETSKQMRELLVRYRNETPAGHSPHMIRHLVDEVLERTKP